MDVIEHLAAHKTAHQLTDRALAAALTEAGGIPVHQTSVSAWLRRTQRPGPDHAVGLGRLLGLDHTAVVAALTRPAKRPRPGPTDRTVNTRLRAIEARLTALETRLDG